MITDQTYPIERAWLIESTFFYFLIFPIILIGSFASILSGKPNYEYMLYMPIVMLPILIPILKRTTFHYTIDDKYLVLQQGIFSKTQRNIPYGVIQNIYLNQDLSDQVFGLASLTLENASDSGSGNNKKIFGITLNNKRRRFALPGFDGNEVRIPGLKKANAEALKQVILQKMKENPVVERGL